MHTQELTHDDIEALKFIAGLPSEVNVVKGEHCEKLHNLGLISANFKRKGVEYRVTELGQSAITTGVAKIIPDFNIGDSVSIRGRIVANASNTPGKVGPRVRVKLIDNQLLVMDVDNLDRQGVSKVEVLDVKSESIVVIRSDDNLDAVEILSMKEKISESTGRDVMVLHLTGSDRIEDLGDEELAAIGLQRIPKEPLMDSLKNVSDEDLAKGGLRRISSASQDGNERRAQAQSEEGKAQHGPESTKALTAPKERK